MRSTDSRPRLPPVKALQAEVTLLKDELARLRASAGPGDLPFWMRGKKK